MGLGAFCRLVVVEAVGGSLQLLLLVERVIFGTYLAKLSVYQ